MNIITEDYVSFETAKLLKEKGFKGDGSHFYENKKIVNFVDYWNRITPHERYCAIECPTLQMAMKWLRKWHNLHCDVGYDFRLGWHIQITSLKEVVQDHDTEMKTYLPHKAVNYPSYEDACEAAIKYCLEKLI